MSGRMNVTDGSYADTAPATAVAAAVAHAPVVVAGGPHAGHARVVARHALRPVEDGERGHDDLGVLEAVAQPLQDGGEVGPLLGYRMPTLAHEAIQRSGAVVRRLQPTKKFLKMYKFFLKYSPKRIEMD